jgi:hypothetical protein
LDADTTLPRGELPTRVPAEHPLPLTALWEIGTPVIA